MRSKAIEPTRINESTFFAIKQTVLVSLLLSFSIIQCYLFGPFNFEITQIYQLSAIELGAFSSLFLYSLSLSLIPVGLLYDKYECKHLLRLAAFLIFVACLIFWLSSSLSVLALNRILCGIGNALAFVGGLKLIATSFRKHTQVLTGIFFALGNIGGVVVNSPYVMLKGAFSWDIVLLANCVLASIICILIFTCLSPAHNLNEENNDDLNIDDIKNFIKKVLTTPYIWYCGIFAGSMFLFDVLFISLWGMRYLTTTYALSEPVAGNIINCYLVGILIGGPVLGYISMRTGLLKSLMVAGGLLSLIFFALLLSGALQSTVSLMMLLGLLGFVACASILAFNYVQLKTPVAYVGIALGFMSLLMNVIGASSEPSFGYLLDYNWDGVTQNNTAIYSANTLTLAFSSLLVTYVIAIMLPFKLKKGI